MNKKLRYIRELLVITSIATIVTIAWQGVELIVLGQITPKKVDNVIGIVLTFSLYGNYKVWIDRS